MDTKKHSAVLLYHRIGLPRLSSLVAGQYVAPGLLVSQVNHLKRRGWQPVDLREILDERQSKEGYHRFALTFDDGYLSVYDIAYPLLRARGIRGTIYIVTSQIGGINQWDRVAGDYQEQMMTAEQIKEVHKHGMEIGSHTLTHPHLSSLSDDKLREEIFDSKKTLEDLLGSEVTGFSYPYGDYNEKVRDVVMEAGYKYAVATNLGVVTSQTGAFDIPRVNVRWNSLGFALVHKIRRAIKRTCESRG